MASSFQKKILWILACLCLATSTVGLWWLDLPVAHALSPYQLEEKQIGQWAPGNSNTGVILITSGVHSAGKVDPLCQLLIRSQIPVAIVEEPSTSVSELVEDFSHKTQLPSEQIVLIGYGEGARALLEAPLGLSPGGMVFLSPQFDLDAVTLAASEDYPILFLSGSADITSSPEQVIRLYNAISGDTILSTGFAVKASQGNCALRIVSQTTGLFSLYSEELQNGLIQWMESWFACTISPISFWQKLRFLCWGGLIGGLVLLLLALYGIASHQMIDLTYAVIPLAVENRSAFLMGKLLLWPLCLPVFVGVLLILWILPGELPVWRVIIGVYLGAYGVTLLALYRKGKVPGIKGNWSPLSANLKIKRILLGLGVFLLTALAGGILYQSGTFFLEGVSANWPWLILLVPMASMGFYLWQYEAILLDAARYPFWVRLLLESVPLLPLVGLILICIPLASFTQVVTLCLYLLVLAISLLTGRVMGLISGNMILSSLCAGLLLAGFCVFTTF